MLCREGVEHIRGWGRGGRAALSQAPPARPHLLQARQGEEGLPQEQAPDVLALPLQDFSNKGSFPHALVLTKCKKSIAVNCTVPTYI
jgi:hypothetical protein